MSTVLGVVGLSVVPLAWVAAVLAVVAYLLNTRHAPTRAFAIVGGTFGVVAIAWGLVG